MKLLSSAESLEIKRSQLELCLCCVNLAVEDCFRMDLISDSKTWTFTRLEVSRSSVAKRLSNNISRPILVYLLLRGSYLVYGIFILVGK